MTHGTVEAYLDNPELNNRGIMEDPHNRGEDRAKNRRVARQREYRAVGILLVLGLVIWILQSTINYYGSHDAFSIVPVLRYLSSSEMIISLVGIVCFVGYGIYVSRIMIEVRRAEEERENLISYLTETKEALHYQATHDNLTGVWNRATILNTLADELARSAREATPVSVILGDVDHFKSINDRHGHLAGDSVLREVSRRLRSCLRSYDSIGRYGGEEFIIILPRCDAEMSERIAERLRSELSSKPIETSDGVFDITMSFGVAAVDGSVNQDIDSVVRSADEALYSAKKGGRNRVEHVNSNG